MPLGMPPHHHPVRIHTKFEPDWPVGCGVAHGGVARSYVNAQRAAYGACARPRLPAGRVCARLTRCSTRRRTRVPSLVPTNGTVTAQ